MTKQSLDHARDRSQRRSPRSARDDRLLPVVLILDNVRSLYNVGAIFRTAEAVAIEKLILVGLTPYPKIPNDPRLPHVSEKAAAAISKTALGADTAVKFEYAADIGEVIEKLKTTHRIMALEQTEDSTNLFDWQPQFPLALIVGHETQGVDEKILENISTVEIPMFGTKESLNVSVATGIALYHLKKLSP